MSTATESTAVSQQSNQSLVLKNDPRITGWKGLLQSDGFKRSLAATLPKHITADRIARVTLSALSQTPKLLDCTPESVVLSLLRAASMGLEPDGGPLGQGYLVPFWNGKLRRMECQFIPGFRGLVKLARNSGEVADVWAEVVFARDKFDYELGIDPKLVHKRNDDVDGPGALKFVYAVARFRDGEKKFVVLNRREINAIKESSASRNKQGELVGPWVDWEPEMWKKSAVRRLAKLLPLSIEDRRLVEAADHDALTNANIDIPAAIAEQAHELSIGHQEPDEESADGRMEELSEYLSGSSAPTLSQLTDALSIARAKNDAAEIQRLEHTASEHPDFSQEEKDQFVASCQGALRKCERGERSKPRELGE